MNIEELFTDCALVCEESSRMHVVNNSTPYQSLMDEIAHFPEIPTAIGVWLVTEILELAASQKLSN